MCPDRQLLSVYIDHELPSPWREKLEAHLSKCPSCASRTAQYREYSEALRDGPETDAEEARARVWKDLSKVLTPAQATVPFARRRRNVVNLPVPAAVAAVLVVALAAAAIGGPLLASRGQEQNMARIGSDVPGIIPVSDMAGILQYLDSQDASADIVIIRLPETRNFISSGEPALVRAADYSRRIAP